jgi:hypothetical protein
VGTYSTECSNITFRAWTWWPPQTGGCGWGATVKRMALLERHTWGRRPLYWIARLIPPLSLRGVSRCVHRNQHEAIRYGWGWDGMGWDGGMTFSCPVLYLPGRRDGLRCSTVQYSSVQYSSVRSSRPRPRPRPRPKKCIRGRDSPCEVPVVGEAHGKPPVPWFIGSAPSSSSCTVLSRPRRQKGMPRNASHPTQTPQWQWQCPRLVASTCTVHGALDSMVRMVRTVWCCVCADGSASSSASRLSANCFSSLILRVHLLRERFLMYRPYRPYMSS